MTGSKYPIPKTSLLAVVVALPPPLPMMQVMILNDNLGIEPLHEPAEGRRDGQMQAQTAVPKHLGENNIFMADPPLVEAHRQPQQPQSEVGHHRHPDHIAEFLLVVRVCREQRIGVLGQVVSAVILPEEADVVHEAMVPVEPEVEHDAVQSDLNR